MNTAYDIIPLPSGGFYYENGCDKVKMYHLTMADEQIMMSPNLLASKKVPEEILNRKVKPFEDGASFVPPSKMLLGDFLALLISLRITMDPFYRIGVLDSDGTVFYENFDLQTLKFKELDSIPNSKKYFDFYLPKSKKTVEFRLMTKEDDNEINMQANKYPDGEGLIPLLRLETLIMSVDGNTDKMEISKFCKDMPTMDGRKLLKYMDDVTPTVDLNIEVISPKGRTIKTMLPMSTEFFFPNLG